MILFLLAIAKILLLVILSKELFIDFHIVVIDFFTIIFIPVFIVVINDLLLLLLLLLNALFRLISMFLLLLLVLLFEHFQFLFFIIVVLIHVHIEIIWNVQIIEVRLTCSRACWCLAIWVASSSFTWWLLSLTYWLSNLIIRCILLWFLRLFLLNDLSFVIFFLIKYYIVSILLINSVLQLSL